MLIDNTLDLPTAVVKAVSSQKGVDEAKLPVLAERIDPDALDAIYRGDTSAAAPTVSFDYAGYRVVVKNRDNIRLHKNSPAPAET